jgi:hypothetical protein
MEYIIVTTNPVEQQESMSYLETTLTSMYLTDTSITLVKSGTSKIVVMHRVGKSYNIAATYKVVIVPVTVNYDKLAGLPFDVNININRLISRLDQAKQEAITYVNKHKTIPVNVKLRNQALVEAVNNMFA